jgi:hypothetical protein
MMQTTGKYRNRLPQLSGGLFLTDGGIETTLIFHDGLELPYFAAFHLLRGRNGREALVRISSATSPSQRRTARASSSRARPGARAQIGATSSDTRPTTSRRPIATRSA